MDYVYECRVPLMTPDFCRHVIDKFEKDENKSAGIVGIINNKRTDETLKKTMDLGIDPDIDPSWADVDNYLTHILNYSYMKYRDHLVNNVLDGNEKLLDVVFKTSQERTVFNIQKYGVGDYFHWHVDDAYMQKRNVAFIMYLNTLSEGDGGETKFWKGKIIRPEEGKILFFPGTWTYTHCGETIKKGSKYIIAGFMEEPLPNGLSPNTGTKENMLRTINERYEKRI